MKKFRNLLMLGCLLIIMLIILAGCTTKKSYTFDVETGDKIKIELKTNGGYNLTSDLPIEFSKDDKVLSKGIFAKEETYNSYLKVIENDENANVIEEKENNNIEYIFYEYKNKEYNYIIKIKESDTCFILGCDKDRETAQEIFKRLSFEVEE